VKLPGTVCRFHGGRAPQVKKAVERRRQEAKANRIAADFALPVDIEPVDAMLQTLAIRWGMVCFLQGLIADMESADELKQLSGGAERYERESVWVAMLDNALREVAKVAKACADMGIDERRTQLAEGTGRQLDEVIRKLLERIMRGLIASGVAADVLADFWREHVPGIVREVLAPLLFQPPPAIGPTSEEDGA